MTVLLSGMLDGAHGATSCRLRDLSRGGACLESDAVLRSGDRVTFIRAALKVTGNVVWARGRRFGMRFDNPIRATDLLVQMSESRRNRPPIAPAATFLFPSR